MYKLLTISIFYYCNRKYIIIMLKCMKKKGDFSTSWEKCELGSDLRQHFHRIFSNRTWGNNFWSRNCACFKIMIKGNLNKNPFSHILVTSVDLCCKRTNTVCTFEPLAMNFRTILLHFPQSLNLAIVVCQNVPYNTWLFFYQDF